MRRTSEGRLDQPARRRKCGLIYTATIKSPVPTPLTSSVFEVPGSVTKRHRRQGTRRGKSDPIDAQAIAEAVLRERDRLPRFERNDAQDAIRLLYDHRDRLVKERTTAGNRLRALALRLGLTELPRELWSVRRLQALRARLEPFRGASLT